MLRSFNESRTQLIPGFSHAHLDHSGYLPRLYKVGFRGPIHTSTGAAELSKILLLDAAHLQEEDAEYANKTNCSHHKTALPLLTKEDTEDALSLFVPHPRESWHPLSEDLLTRPEVSYRNQAAYFVRGC